MLLTKIITLIEGQMNAVESELDSSFSSDISLVNELVSHTVNSGGKRIRPMFHILSAGLCGYGGEYTAKIGTILEYVHTASLLHDDVIDNADTRRGKPSANTLYGNSVTILSGDYLYTSAFRNIIKLPGREFAEVLTGAVSSMSEGEILQLLKTGDITLTMNEYKRIIYGKTAALFSAACECGALLGKAPEKVREELKNYGTNIGYAFQMKDDMLDYFGDKASTGKNPGTDLAERKVTLPILLMLAEDDINARETVCEIFLADRPVAQKLEELLEVFSRFNILQKAEKYVDMYVEAALQNLAGFPDSAYKEALEALTRELGHRIS